MGNIDIFETVAKEYDTPPRVHLARVAADAIREYLVDSKHKTAIDFGCGTGLVGLDLLNNFKTMLFLDAAPNMVEQIKLKVADLNIENADTLCFDFEKGSRPDLHADYIFMANVLLHIKDARLVLARLYDVLNAGGRLLIVEFNKNAEIVSDMVHNGFEQAELSGMMTKIGYRDIQSSTFYSGSKIFMGHDASMFILAAQK